MGQRGDLSPRAGLPRLQATELILQWPPRGKTESQGLRKSDFLGYVCLVLLFFKFPFISCGAEREQRGTDYNSNMLFGKKLENTEKHKKKSKATRKRPHDRDNGLILVVSSQAQPRRFKSQAHCLVLCDLGQIT